MDLDACQENPDRGATDLAVPWRILFQRSRCLEMERTRRTFPSGTFMALN